MEIPTLMLATLGIAVVIGVILLLRHMRKPENRHSMDGERERNIDEIRHEATPRDDTSNSSTR